MTVAPPDAACVGREHETTDASSRMFSPFQRGFSSSSAIDSFGDVAMQVDAFIGLSLYGCNSAKVFQLRSLRGGEVFSFNVGGVIHDIVVELKVARSARGEMVQHVSLLPLTVVTNRRYVYRLLISNMYFMRFQPI